MGFGAVDGQIGRFRKNSSFLFPFSPVSPPVADRKREQKSGNGRKTPKRQEKRAGKPKFSCPSGVQICEKPRKTPKPTPQACREAINQRREHKFLCRGRKILPYRLSTSANAWIAVLAWPKSRICWSIPSLMCGMPALSRAFFRYGYSISSGSQNCCMNSTRP